MTACSRQALCWTRSSDLSASALVLFGTLWTSIYASRRITVPIKALAEATGKLAEGGYGHRVEVAATDHLDRWRHKAGVEVLDSRRVASRAEDWWTAWKQFWY